MRFKLFEEYSDMDYVKDNLDGRIPKSGDYVEIKHIPDYAEDVIGTRDKRVKIIDSTSTFDFKFQFIDNSILFGNIYFVRRYLTDEEIKDYEMKLEMHKYNL